jgi:pyruvate/2-oxoglutarate dehydrogenase complex dihydrolipoamide dehydrogenase (E3) component
VPWLDSKGVTLVRGSARLTGDRTLDVDGRELVARRAVVLATGTSAAMPPITGLADVHPWDNRSATAAKEVPRRLLVLGGGAIGVELAQAFRRLGSDDVTIVEGAPRLLGREEPFAGEEVAGALRAEGITVLTGVSMVSVRRQGRDGPVSAVLGDGRALEADELLVAVGRRPATADLGLERAGLEPGRYVEVDDTMRSTSVPWLFAVGDCNGRALLTHMGKYQARIAADVILGKPARASGPVSRVTFTDPQVAAVGLTEAEARERLGDARVRTVRHDMASLAAASTLGDGVGGTGLLVVDDDRRVVVGATFTGPNVAELLHSATVAVAGEVPLDRLWHAVPSFPTMSEVWLRLLETYGL